TFKGDGYTLNMPTTGLDQNSLAISDQASGENVINTQVLFLVNHDSTLQANKSGAILTIRGNVFPFNFPTDNPYNLTFDAAAGALINMQAHVGGSFAVNKTGD